MDKKKQKVLWAVNYKTQNHREGWLVAKAYTAEDAIKNIMEELADPASDYFSLKVEFTAYRCGKWL